MVGCGVFVMFVSFVVFYVVFQCQRVGSRPNIDATHARLHRVECLSDVVEKSKQRDVSQNEY